MWNQTVTLWCKSSSDIWYRYIVKSCTWENDATRKISGDTAYIVGSVELFVKENPFYKPPNEWENLPEHDKYTYFTFHLGDIVALGVYTAEINSTQFTKTQLKEYLLPDVLEIFAIEDNSQPYKQGRHYYIKGT